MKKLLTLIVMVMLGLSLMAQSTGKISYQAVVRDGNNRLVTNATVAVKVTIGSYVENFTAVQTNANGLVSLLIGNEAGFDAIDWSNATIKTTVHIGSETVTNEVPVTAVPYALRAHYSTDVNPASPTIIAIYNKMAADSTTQRAALADTASALRNNIPTKTSQLTNDANFVNNTACNTLTFCGLASRITELETTQETTQLVIDSLKDVISQIQNKLPVPTVTTSEVSNISSTAATLAGNLVSAGITAVSERGFCYSTTETPTTAGTHVAATGTGTGSFTSGITGLTPATTYYVRAYATSGGGTAYGEQRSFTTKPTIPTVTTNTVSSITTTTATCGGNVTATGGASVTARGVCWSTSQNPTVSDSHTTNGTGTGSFTSSMTGLTAGTTYYVRAYATNSVGTSYGAQRSFTTPTIPTVTTNTVSNIAATTASCGGNVTATGGADVTARGVCWSTSQNPTVSGSHTTNGTGTGSFTSSITGLTASTTYYVRAYATNSVGTAYGTQQTFTTPSSFTCGTSTVKDVDNNTYNTVQIGTQCWMKENLRTTKYANGTAIAVGTSSSTTTPYRYAPNGNESNVATYGYLYNWPAVMNGASSSDANPSGVQGICPTGWHVPSDAEWTQLTNYVSSQSQYVCGNANIAKALASTTGWNSGTATCAVGNIPGNNNKTGFSALPAGYFYNGSYYLFGGGAYLWCATLYSSTSTLSRGLYFNDAYVDRNYYSSKHNAFSVRCLRD